MSAADSVDFIPDFTSKFIPKEDLLGRFQIHQGCPNLPGVCAVCGSSTGLMFDFGIELDFYGHVYICVANCAKEMANKLGYFSVEQVDQIKEQFNKLLEAQKMIVEENKDLHNAVDSFSRLRVEHFDSSVDQLVLDASAPEHAEESTESVLEESGDIKGEQPVSEPESPATSKKSISRKTGSTKQANGKGSGSIPDDDSLEILDI